MAFLVGKNKNHYIHVYQTHLMKTAFTASVLIQFSLTTFPVFAYTLETSTEGGKEGTADLSLNGQDRGNPKGVGKRGRQKRKGTEKWEKM